MTKTQIIRAVAFLLVAVMFIVLMCDLFECENTTSYDQNMYTYRHLKKDTVDAVFLGTSGVDRYWIGPKAYEEYGISLYPLSFDAFPAWLYTDILDEIEGMQDTKLVLIDIRAFLQTNIKSGRVEIRARRYLDSLPFFSASRIKVAFKTMKMLHEIDPENYSEFDPSFLLSFIKYHSRWKENMSIENNLGSKTHPYGGYFMSDRRVVKSEEQEKVVYRPDVTKDLDPISEEALYDLISYVKEKDMKVLFVDTPQFLTENEMARVNTVYQILDKEDMDYVHFYKDNSDEFAIDLDYTTDYYDESHVNYYGAEKFTEALATYIDENYDLPDSRKNKTAKEFWDGKYDKLKSKIAVYEAEKKKED
ncbi:MAG: hypothetical protein E7652_03290 [Ruminococcaceae bacterium]|nr:hypothetical protein [Oscillospiraceae bacterium]